MNYVKELEEILNEVPGNAHITVSISYDEAFNEHMTVKSYEIEIVNGNLQINSGYIECSIDLNKSDINIEEDDDIIEFIDISYGNLFISLGIN